MKHCSILIGKAAVGQQWSPVAITSDQPIHLQLALTSAHHRVANSIISFCILIHSFHSSQPKFDRTSLSAPLTNSEWCHDFQSNAAADTTKSVHYPGYLSSTGKQSITASLRGHTHHKKAHSHHSSPASPHLESVQWP